MTCHDCLHKYCCKYDRFFGVDEVENKCCYFKNEADFVEVVYGKWIDLNISGWQCSECNYIVEHYNNTPYCPKCGANMEGDKKYG